ncbi:hypothetical protein [Pseudaestuariivita atlantica]|uniref:Uncharacterized protein n=1 Tax=Pseudaestuariivita atlantica TaxID=1317121 RepID=A0A0L1JSC6_9RHOB|nr:hypothetical protein [Pseudaestuariivita atlantica]KNG94689.1 hypothetical protein ATO11_04655 [Pseudaestuariivita atlantica]
MSDYALTKVRLFEGVWEGVVTRLRDGAGRPNLKVTHLEQPLEGVSLSETQDEGAWDLKVRVPAEAIADGVQTVLITDGDTDETLGSFAILAGEALGDDIRAEMDLLRAELDMLKRAFRRHCVETT